MPNPAPLRQEALHPGDGPGTGDARRLVQQERAAEGSPVYTAPPASSSSTIPFSTERRSSLASLGGFVEVYPAANRCPPPPKRRAISPTSTLSERKDAFVPPSTSLRCATTSPPATFLKRSIASLESSSPAPVRS